MGITTVWESSAMSAVSRREPRVYVDFNSVPAHQTEMDNRLWNWKRWSDSRTQQKSAPGFELHKTDQWDRREYGTQTSVPVDVKDAVRIHVGVAAPDFPDKERRALNWHYIRPTNATAKASELGVGLAGLAELVVRGRQMLLNRKV